MESKEDVTLHHNAGQVNVVKEKHVYLPPILYADLFKINIGTL
ncbi:hypothetical protein HNP36_000292 [Chryseobacterium shigense]|uniref:Uncharacterized protein n=1 Tax=Chryseobacterium shigense TaxID=297244 RepID=A0A841ND19_9FLAO|nr:hypothetical protein [Chryseobacterium shigense]